MRYFFYNGFGTQMVLFWHLQFPRFNLFIGSGGDSNDYVFNQEPFVSWEACILGCFMAVSMLTMQTPFTRYLQP